MAHLTEYTLHLVMKRQSFKSSNIIGVSLSEPHTSVTALCMHVCNCGLITYHKLMSAFKYFTKINIVKHVEGYFQSAVSGTQSEDD